MTTEGIEAEIIVERPLYVIGDIHGRLDLLDAMLERIYAERATDEADIVVLGDMIDRGPDSFGVLDRLRELTDVICLMGNHEHMMLNFLQDPAREGARWLRNGGDATLLSAGISKIGTTRFEELRDQLTMRLRADRTEWLASLPLIWKSGSVAVAHAGLDPRRAPDRQVEQSLIWGHRKFLQTRRKDELVVVHGHWPCEAAHYADGRVSVDTWAWKTGRLSAARISASGISFLEVTGHSVA